MDDEGRRRKLTMKNEEWCSKNKDTFAAFKILFLPQNIRI